jgi:predicted amidohydrolase YtcJ
VSWKPWVLLGLAFAAGFSTLFSIATRPPAPPEHQVFINGEVLTMDAENRVAQALSVRSDRIEMLGTNEQIMALVSDQTEVIDLAGRTLMPGFIDAHGHFPGSALNTVAVDLNSPPIGGMTDIPGLLDALRVRAATLPAGEWVAGFGYDDTLLAEGRHPTRAELDSVSSEHPVAILHISAHMVVANSAALEQAGIGADTPDPEGGVIAREPGSRTPSGLLEETARLPVMAQMLDLGPLDFLGMVSAAVREYAEYGVTTAQAGGVAPEMARGFKLASFLGLLPLRLVVFPMQDDFGDAILAGEFDPEDYSSKQIQVGPVKIVADGSIQGFTGYLTRPYHTPFQSDADYRGYPAVLRERLFEQINALHSAGYQIAVHGNGDASIDDILDAFEAAQAAHPVADPRLILIHAQMAREDQLERMAKLGVTPSFFAAHTWFWGDRHRDLFLGPDRAAQISPAAWAQAAGLRFTSHMDTPVTPMRPLQAVWSLVHRQTLGGEILGPEQRVDTMTALRAVTIDAAWQVFQEDNRGSLEPGKYADLVLLNGSPLRDSLNMRELQVDATWVGGALIYKRG